MITIEVFQTRNGYAVKHKFANARTEGSPAGQFILGEVKVLEARLQGFHEGAVAASEAAHRAEVRPDDPAAPVIGAAAAQGGVVDLGKIEQLREEMKVSGGIRTTIGEGPDAFAEQGRTVRQERKDNLREITDDLTKTLPGDSGVSGLSPEDRPAGVHDSGAAGHAGPEGTPGEPGIPATEGGGQDLSVPGDGASAHETVTQVGYSEEASGADAGSSGSDDGAY